MFTHFADTIATFKLVWLTTTHLSWPQHSFFRLAYVGELGMGAREKNPPPLSIPQNWRRRRTERKRKSVCVLKKWSLGPAPPEPPCMRMFLAAISHTHTVVSRKNKRRKGPQNRREDLIVVRCYKGGRIQFYSFAHCCRIIRRGGGEERKSLWRQAQFCFDLGPMEQGRKGKNPRGRETVWKKWQWGAKK